VLRVGGELGTGWLDRHLFETLGLGRRRLLLLGNADLGGIGGLYDLRLYHLWLVDFGWLDLGGL
jgi:hypothetical protein